MANSPKIELCIETGGNSYSSVMAVNNQTDETAGMSSQEQFDTMTENDCRAGCVPICVKSAAITIH